MVDQRLEAPALHSSAILRRGSKTTFFRRHGQHATLGAQPSAEQRLPEPVAASLPAKDLMRPESHSTHRWRRAGDIPDRRPNYLRYMCFAFTIHGTALYWAKAGTEVPVSCHF